MKRFIYTLPLMILLLVTMIGNCQKDIYNVRYQTVLNANANPPTYNTTENFVVGDITSDYGRRNCEECSSPDIPSAKQMQSEGLDIGEMQIKLLQKIEELTLYVIDLKKENEEMRNNNAEMKTEIEKLKRR